MSPVVQDVEELVFATFAARTRLHPGYVAQMVVVSAVKTMLTGTRTRIRSRQEIVLAFPDSHRIERLVRRGVKKGCDHPAG